MSEPLTLAYLADANSVHTRRWVAYFAERGHDVHLLLGEHDPVREGLPASVTLHRYRRFGRRRLPLVSSLQGRRSLRRTLAAIGPDVIHAHYLTRHGWQARLSGLHPYVVSPWGSDLFVTPRTSLRARGWALLALRGADLVTVVSEEMRAAVRRYGVRPHRIAIVHFGVDTRHFVPREVADVGARWQLPGRRVVFSPRAIRPIYRQDVVIAALAALPPDVGLVLTERNADPATLADARRQARALGVDDRVRFAPDIDDHEMLQLFQGAAAIVSVPESDATPISVLEAMACGKPVVASDLPGPRELLGLHDPRLLVPVGDTAATKEALRRAIDLTREERERLGARLRAHVVEHADRERNMKHMEDLYFQLRDRAA